jgi:hypothetical protein
LHRTFFLKHALCAFCEFDFLIADLNKHDEETYECPNCHKLCNIKDLYLFDR